MDKKGKEVDIKTYQGMDRSLLYLIASRSISCLVYVYGQDFNHVKESYLLVLKKPFLLFEWDY